MKYTQGAPTGTVLPDGEYPFECVNATEQVSKSSGSDMIEVSLKIGADGPTVRDYLQGGEKTRWKLDNFRSSIGEPIKPGAEIDIDPDSFVGKHGRCLLYSDEWEGRRRNKVSDYVIPLGGGNNQPPAAPADPAAKPNPPAGWR